jgi:DNA-binding XRE family transcriptional regulator
MSTFVTAFKEQVRRLARKEVRLQVQALKRATTQFRRDIAALRRVVAKGGQVVPRLLKTGAIRAEGLPEGVRFSARSIRAQRVRLGISAADFGKLIGVTPLTIYHWEAGKARPRAKQFANFLSIRNIKKEEAFKRLGLTPGELGRRGRRRGRKPAA